MHGIGKGFLRTRVNPNYRREMNMLIIDRFEGDFAVAENTDNDKMVKIEKSMIDKTVREGDVIFLTEDGYKTDHEATEKRRNEIAELLKSIDIKK